ncbi:peptide deformylase [Rhodohalobacter sulfatireducens]|uniref:Peptide deformylase n=1 Tax=Rhodohalobacter sulfatireducens TaxID=2911366 RepID=A0ABS9KCS5_9BACT|nr:peptide deformylase [Rhodohalobacter sulfatireducens]MCG2588630.1 peptide deformylase [Rhodohalobacter sulfatireducens]
MSVLPIVTYNDPILKKETEPISENSEELQSLIDDMFETMYKASGVGLAAPQIGKSIQLFVMDADAITEEMEGEPDIGPVTLINPKIVKKSNETVKMEEGCLSIPDVRDDVSRPESITVKFRDRDLNEQTMDATGWIARVIQHEIDHLQGVLFLDYLSAFKRRLHKSTLKKIDKGKLETEYPLADKS